VTYLEPVFVGVGPEVRNVFTS